MKNILAALFLIMLVIALIGIVDVLSIHRRKYNAKNNR